MSLFFLLSLLLPLLLTVALAWFLVWLLTPVAYRRWKQMEEQDRTPRS